MNNLNPLLKHKKIGRVLGWDDFQNSTKEGIKKALKKERNKGRIGPIILSHPIFTGIENWHIYSGYLALLISPLPFLGWIWQQKRATDVSDEEIEEQLVIYKKWAGKN